MNRWLRFVTLALAAFVLPAAANAVQLGTPTLASEVQGHAKIVVLVVAADTGAPAGFELQWMRFSDFLANGGQFHEAPDAAQSEARFTGIPTLNTWGGSLTSFTLEPSSVAAVEIGDLFDETGVTTNGNAELELVTNTLYIFRARANATATEDASGWSNVFIVDTAFNLNCTYTLGFWKNHLAAWPVTSLTLGTVTYGQSELLAILGEPARGNGLVILAHQLIATLLNIAQGADAASVSSVVSSAHSAIGSLVIPPTGGGHLSPGSTGGLTQTLDDFNNGVIGPGHCGTVGVEPSPWAKVKSAYR